MVESDAKVVKKMLSTFLHEKVFVVSCNQNTGGGAFWGGGFDGNVGNDRQVMDRISVKNAIHFALSMPNDVLVTGAKDADMLQEKIDLANSFVKLRESEQDELIAKVADFGKNKVEYYKL